MNSNLNSVTARIGQAVVAFYEHRLLINMPEFRAEELRMFVSETVGKTAPGSADRILRDRRQSGRINYEIVSRKDSKYRFTPVLTGETVAA